MIKIKGNRTNVGAWAPSCIQHGFTDCPTFTDSRFKAPFNGGKIVN